MTQSEAEIQNAILLEFGREPDLTLFRNNTGVHKSEITTRAHLERLFSFLTTARNENQLKAGVSSAVGLIRSLLGESSRFTPYGLCNGSSDIVGIVQTSFCIHREGDIDQKSCCEDKFGIMLAAEVKRPSKQPTDEQQQFIDLVNRRGGVAGCVHSVDEMRSLIERARAL